MSGEMVARLEEAFRGRPDEYEGAYRDIVNIVNSTLDAMTEPLWTAVDYVKRMSEGQDTGLLTNLPLLVP